MVESTITVLAKEVKKGILPRRIDHLEIEVISSMPSVPNNIASKCNGLSHITLYVSPIRKDNDTITDADRIVLKVEYSLEGYYDLQRFYAERSLETKLGLMRKYGDIHYRDIPEEIKEAIKPYIESWGKTRYKWTDEFGHKHKERETWSNMYSRQFPIDYGIGSTQEIE